MQATVRVDGFDAVRRSLDRLPADLRDRAAVAAINKTAAKANTEVNRAIRDEFAVDAGMVRNSISVRRASAKSPTSIQAVLDIFGSPNKRGRSLNMIHFLAAVKFAGRAARLRGAKVKAGQLKTLAQQIGFVIKRGGGLKEISGAFLGNKGRTIFVRTGKGRLPIEPLQVIGISQMFTTERVRRRVMDRIERELVVETERAVKMVMERFGR